MNMDRHDRNISHDTSTNKVQIFDHGRAFLDAGQNDISATLTGSHGKLCIGGHCLASEICDLDGKDMWVDRIQKIPDFFIEGIIDAATSVGLPPDKKSDCIEFMKKRRSEIGVVIDANLNQFPKLLKAVAA